jgi:hypothetical protein
MLDFATLFGTISGFGIITKIQSIKKQGRQGRNKSDRNCLAEMSTQKNPENVNEALINL